MKFLNRLILLTLLAIGVLMSNYSKADQAIVFGGWSSHSESTYTYKGETHDLNENNYSLGYERNHWGIVASKLSFDNWGIVGYYDLVLAEWTNTTLSFRIGAVYGYKNTPQNTTLMPIVLPTLTQRVYGELYFQASALANKEMYIMTGNFIYRF